MREAFEAWFSAQPHEQYGRWIEDQQRYTIWSAKNQHWQTWCAAVRSCAGAAVLMIEDRPLAKDWHVVVERNDIAEAIGSLFSTGGSCEKQDLLTKI